MVFSNRNLSKSLWPTNFHRRYKSVMSSLYSKVFLLLVWNRSPMRRDAVILFSQIFMVLCVFRFDRKEVPLFMDKKLTYEAHNLHSLISLPKVLLTEESIAYRSTIPADPGSNLVTQVYNSSGLCFYRLVNIAGFLHRSPVDTTWWCLAGQLFSGRWTVRRTSWKRKKKVMKWVIALGRITVVMNN